MAKITVRFTKAINLGADSFQPGDVAALDAALAQMAIEGRVAVAEKAAPEAAVAKPAENAARPAAKGKK